MNYYKRFAESSCIYILVNLYTVVIYPSELLQPAVIQAKPYSNMLYLSALNGMKQFYIERFISYALKKYISVET